MELATFKRSILTQINVIKKCLCVCTYVCLLDFWLMVYFVFRLFVKPYLIQFRMYLC